MPRKLKVFRTAIGFEDAYVAAPSRKAALEAWGTDKDLFARGAAEEVTDPALVAEPLDRPGLVVRRTRGSASDHAKALATLSRPRSTTGRKPPPTADAQAPKRPSRPQRPPRPAREEVTEAIEALKAMEGRQNAQLKALEQRERALAEERSRIERDLAAERERLSQRLRDAEERYATALEAWRAG